MNMCDSSGMRDIKLGSLFDGSRGFPLAGVLNGMVPIWASEIEPYPLRVTSLRLNIQELCAEADKARKEA